MRRIQFSVLGKHPLLLLTRDFLVRQGYYLRDTIDLDPEVPAFLLVGAEVYDHSYPALFSNVRLMENYPVLLLSSSSVYSDRNTKLDPLPVSVMDEAHGHLITSPLDPAAVRPLTALQIESLALQRSGPRTIVVRPFNVYGEHVQHGVIHTFLNEAKTGVLHVNNPGYQIRTFLYEEDFLEAIRLLVPKLLKGHRGIYNLGSEEQVSIISLAKSISHASGKDLTIEMTDNPVRFSHWKIPNIDRIKTEIQWAPKASLRSTLFRLAKV